MSPRFFIIVSAILVLGTCPIACSSERLPPPSGRVEDRREGDGICQVHQCEMRTVRTRDVVGHISYTHDYLMASAEHFPNSGIHYPPSMRSADEILIYVCPDCKAAREAWMREATRQ